MAILAPRKKIALQDIQNEFVQREIMVGENALSDDNQAGKKLSRKSRVADNSKTWLATVTRVYGCFNRAPTLVARMRNAELLDK